MTISSPKKAKTQRPPDMRKPRLVMIGIAVILIIGQLLILDYQYLFSRGNRASFLGILSALFLILSMILSNIHDSKNKPE
jgi:hypothetical protein